LVYGWLLKYIIDEIYTKDNLRMITKENSLLRERINVLEAQSVQRMKSTPQPVQRVEPKPVATPKPTPSASRKDDLKLIKGIGRQLEKKLNNAGVNTFEQMSRLTTTDLQNIFGISKRAGQKADHFLTQARKFAQSNARK
jgi:predicted flap endonuclease-1-like 5' DNA nuclease